MVPLQQPIDWQESSETATPSVAEAEREGGSPLSALLRSYRRANAQPTSAALLRLAQPAALDGARQSRRLPAPAARQGIVTF